MRRVRVGIVVIDAARKIDTDEEAAQSALAPVSTRLHVSRETEDK
jgi:hypothetical protein